MMPKFDVQFVGGHSTTIDAEDEEQAAGLARDHGAPVLSIKKHTDKKASSSTAKKPAAKKAAPRKRK
jgi:hypothetical protein